MITINVGKSVSGDAQLIFQSDGTQSISVDVNELVTFTLVYSEGQHCYFANDNAEINTALLTSNTAVPIRCRLGENRF